MINHFEYAQVHRAAGPAGHSHDALDKRWGHGHEDVYPVTQFEKLWGDMSALHDVPCSFVVVPRLRGQQLKAQAQLDGWLRDGSAAYAESLGDWD